MISAIIPARNEEASIARAVETVAAQAEVGEVIVVNDQSSDGTSAILAGLAARIPKLKVMETGELPAGWVGKNYAAAMGAAAAQGDWLLFTDADTYHYPGSAKRALADAAEHDAALVSYSPEQEMETFWEAVLIPVVYWRLSDLYAFKHVNDPSRPDAAANGQFLLINSEAYKAMGGHEAVANEILEDVALARRVKQSGRRIYFAAGQGIVRVRMYRSFWAMWEGWTKNLYLLVKGSQRVAVGGAAGALISELMPALVIAMFFIEPAGGLKKGLDWYVFLTLIAFAVILVIDFLKKSRPPIFYILYLVPGICLYTAALIASWWKTTRGSVNWKGRAYPARTS